MRLDLVNLFPVKLDLKPFIDAWGSAARFQIYAPNGTLNFCGVDVAPEAAGTIQTNDVYTTGATVGVPLYAAELTEVLYEGVDIEPADYLGNGNEPGVLAFEAVEAGQAPTLAVLLGDDMVFRYELPLSLSSVRNMYRWRNMRALCGGSVSFGYQDALGEPGNLPDGETNGKDIFFLHGFNVSEAAARNWANQMFKRMWLSGSRARFHGIAWYGDYRIGEDMNPLDKMNAFFYHRDVLYALQTASAFKGYAESAQPDPSKRVVMAQSLGNMVASEALRQGLQAGQFLMFNAAVASEAYDASLHDMDAGTRSSFVPEPWRSYAPLSWASKWHLLFPDDSRRDQRWRGLFTDALTNATEICNYYSSGDEVLEADTIVVNPFSNLFTAQWSLSFSWSWPFIHLESGSFQFTFERNAWQKQEVLKGVDPYLARLDGGWGFHQFQDSTASGMSTVWRPYTPAEANALIADGSIVTNAVFERSASAMFSPTNTPAETYEVIAYNIPAVSYAAGSVATFYGLDEKVDLNANNYRNGWGRNGISYGQRWLHSDMKDMSYLYVFPLYNELVRKIQGGQ